MPGVDWPMPLPTPVRPPARDPAQDPLEPTVDPHPVDSPTGDPSVGDDPLVDAPPVAPPDQDTDVVVIPAAGGDIIFNQPTSHRQDVPGPRRKETKITGRPAAIMRVLSAISEVPDVADAMYAALTPKQKRKCGKAKTPQAKLACVYRNWADTDNEQAAKMAWNVIWGQVLDRAYAKVAKKIQRANLTGQIFSPLTGAAVDKRSFGDQSYSPYQQLEYERKLEERRAARAQRRYDSGLPQRIQF